MQAKSKTKGFIRKKIPPCLSAGFLFYKKIKGLQFAGLQVYGLNSFIIIHTSHTLPFSF
jgi:hypothetical protein